MNDFGSAIQLAEKYRPQTLEDVVGQPNVVSIIKGFLKSKQVPSTILISGQTGLGKSTLAYLISYLINELPYGTATTDILDHNIGAEGNKEDIEKLIRLAQFKPKANFRVIILDEVQRLSTAAASALLKPLEKPLRNTVWILVTNEPEKLLKTIVGRSLHLTLRGLEPEDLVPRLRHICKKEKVDFINDKTLLSIARNAYAEPRSAIGLLQSTIMAYHGCGKNLKLALAQALESYGAGIDMLAAKMLACVYSNRPKGIITSVRKLKANEYISVGMYLLFHNGFLLDTKVEIDGWQNEARKKLLDAVSVDKIPLKKIVKVHEVLVGIKKELATFLVPEQDLIMAKLLALTGEEK
jgi:DNA polymerase III gamma/tau subunit